MSNDSTRNALLYGGAALVTGAAIYAAYRAFAASSSAAEKDDLSFGGASSSMKGSSSSSKTAAPKNGKGVKAASSSTYAPVDYPFSPHFSEFPWGSDPTADKVQELLAALNRPAEREGRRLTEAEEKKLMAELMPAIAAMRKQLCGFEKARLPSNSSSMKGTAGEVIEKAMGGDLPPSPTKNANGDQEDATNKKEGGGGDADVAPGEDMSKRFDADTLRKRRIFASTLSDAAQTLSKLSRVREAGDLYFEACNAFRALAYKNPNRDDGNTPDSIDSKELQHIKHEDVLHAACLTSRGSFLEDLNKKKEALLCHKAAVDICFMLFDQASIRQSTKRARQQHQQQQQATAASSSRGGQQKQQKQDDDDDDDGSDEDGQGKGTRTNHPIFARCLNNMGSLLFNMQQHETGMRMLTDALTMRKRLTGDGRDSADLAESMTNLGMILTRSPTKAEEGMNLMSIACEMYKRVQGGHPSLVLAQAQNSLGGALVQCGMHLQQAVQQVEPRIRDSQASKMEAMKQQKAMADAAQEMVHDGIQFKNLAVTTLRKFCSGRPDPALCAILTEVGGAMGMLGQRQKALEFKTEAMQVAEKLYAGDGAGSEQQGGAAGEDSSDAFGSDSYQLATTYYSLGITLIGVDKKHDGIEKLRKALAIMRRLAEKPVGKNNVELKVQLVNNLKVLGVSLENVGEKEEGAALQKESEDLRKSLQAEADSRSAATAALTAAAGVRAV